MVAWETLGPADEFGPENELSTSVSRPVSGPLDVLDAANVPRPTDVLCPAPVLGLVDVCCPAEVFGPVEVPCPTDVPGSVDVFGSEIVLSTSVCLIHLAQRMYLDQLM